MPSCAKPGENSTIWVSASPKFIMGSSDEDAFNHPCQKPVDLMRRPILNHLRRGELVYDPFLALSESLPFPAIFRHFLTHRLYVRCWTPLVEPHSMNSPLARPATSKKPNTNRTVTATSSGIG